MTFSVDIVQDPDGRWTASVPTVPGATFTSTFRGVAWFGALLLAASLSP